MPSPTAACIYFARISGRSLIIAFGILTLVEIGLISYLVSAEKFGASRVVGRWMPWFITNVIGLVLVMLGAALPALLRRHGVAFDERGMWWLGRGGVVGVEWEHVAAVGVDRELAAGRAWLEVYPTDPAFASQRPELSIFREATPQRYPELGEYRFRFPLPTECADRVAEAVTRFRPEVWLEH